MTHVLAFSRFSRFSSTWSYVRTSAGFNSILSILLIQFTLLLSTLVCKISTGSHKVMCVCLL